MKHLFGFACYVDSLGVTVGERNEFAVSTMGEIGVNLSRHRPKTFDDIGDGSADLIICLSREAYDRAIEATRHLATEVEFWDIPDPTLVEGNRDARLAAFRAVRDLLRRRIEARFDGLAPKLA